ncbi:MAG TPA: exo-alpha-sialidase [Actinocrinis sp.]|uniref:exo-alpha-sialidase n=1 Tax=Actinocrinis sp. TaxID=1920516 RepID=UPI002DDD707B|nr:exo-alpha-sialidase [Actinocrinis sp.]HEV2346714.1 exo-alpha-sialidase [Actinocrinis sp.]
MLTPATTTNDFSISASPSAATVTAGNSATSTISTAVTSGSAQSVALSTTGLPAGASASFNPASVTAGGSSTLTLSTAASTPNGSYSITITGTGTSATHSTPFTLTVGTSGGITLTQVSTDPFTDTDAQHATEVEPDTFAYGSTIVSAFQVGRVYGGGSSDLGWATSTNGGSTWSHGFMPGLTVNQGGSYAQVSDAAVAYDAKHGEWMVVGLPIDSTGNAVGVMVNRSTDGLTWQSATQAAGFDGQGYDKQWVVCDDTSTSPFYGNCYIELDITSSFNTEAMAVSSDGGVTWSALNSPSGSPTGLGGQPLVQPNGTVVVPYSNNGSAIDAFTSTNGGSSWNASVQVATVNAHTVNGGLRDGEGLPSAEIDSSGKVYVAWQDCRFRSGCPSNDIVYSTSTNGTSWSAVTRVPIDATSSTVDHFIPGLGVDHATSGTTAKLGLYYYFYPNANCSASTCQMEVGYISSANGGSTWSAPQTVAGPFSLSQIASTSQGNMVGDYISCSVLNGNAYALFAVGKTPTNGLAFDEAMYTAGGLPVTGGALRAANGPIFGGPGILTGTTPQLRTLR